MVPPIEWGSLFPLHLACQIELHTLFFRIILVSALANCTGVPLQYKGVVSRTDIWWRGLVYGWRNMHMVKNPIVQTPAGLHHGLTRSKMMTTPFRGRKHITAVLIRFGRQGLNQA